MAKFLKLTCIVSKDGSEYIALCPELDVASEGKTPKEALRNLREAVEGHVQVAQEEGILDELLARRKAKVTELTIPLSA
ncbi:type II toxin-antitoxin system HicB family antitoxin [Candidatus Woesearchaeota archaeon]|nr:MAG: type II toxin-antitoxin system HicB family antitoxin [Candidatus Woesearchaeota archaeon]